MNGHTDLIFTKAPVVYLATNTFVDVPVILQYEDTPLIELVQEIDASFTTLFTIFDGSGSKLAVAKGTQLYLTEAGEKDAQLELRHEPTKTICVRGNETLFEIDRVTAAALRARAELFAPDGRFVVTRDIYDLPLEIMEGPNGLQIGKLQMAGNQFGGCHIGIKICADGSIALGANA